MPPLQQTIKPERVSGIILFVREITPPCHRCEEARTWLRENLEGVGVTVTEYPINKNPAEWTKFHLNYPESVGVPQIVLVMKNGSTMNINTYSELTRIFSLGEKAKENA